MLHPWQLVKGLSGKQPHNSPYNGVRFADKTYLDPKMIANTFAHQFTPPPIYLTDDKSKGQLKRQFHQFTLTETPSFTPPTQRKRSDWPNRPQPSDQTGFATSTSFYSLKVPLPISLTSSICQSQLVRYLKYGAKAIITHTLKLCKDNKIGMNWCPISLLCPAAKTMEELLLPRILAHIPLYPAQHGFRPKHSTCTALSTITADIAASFSRKKLAHRKVLVALDLTAAFVIVDHQ